MLIPVLCLKIHDTLGTGAPEALCTQKFEWMETEKKRSRSYYHLHPSLKCDEFCAKFYFSNVNGLSGYVSLLTNETLAVML